MHNVFLCELRVFVVNSFINQKKSQNNRSHFEIPI
jgi:hypothetical protein